MRIKHYIGAKIKPAITSDTSSGTEFIYENTEGVQIVTLDCSQNNGEKWRLGRCPRCHGDVFLDSDDGELLGHCLQCGYVGTRIVINIKDIK